MFTRSLLRFRRVASSRPGIAIALVAVSLVVMLGMLSLALDVGWMMNTKDQLQNAADSAALAGAESLYLGPNAALQAASDYTVLNRSGEKFAQIDPAVDVVFGSSFYDLTTGTWTFTPGGAPTDSIQVTVRRTKTSPGGSLPLFFSGVLGRTVSNISATATAKQAGIDMAFVADISGSMWHDSSLYHLFTHPREETSYPIAGTAINSFDAWVALQSEGEGVPFSTAATNHIQYRTQSVFGQYQAYTIPSSFTGAPGQNGVSIYAGMNGPSWGLIGNYTIPVGLTSPPLPYGNNPDPATYATVESDPGLVFLPMGTFSFRPEPNFGNYNLSKISSSTSPLHTSADDTKSADGNLIGTLASPAVNGGLGSPGSQSNALYPWVTANAADLPTGVLGYLSSQGYSPEEQYLLRMPQDASDLSPRNPGENNAQENTNASHWQDRVAVMLGLADWNSHLVHPAFLVPPKLPPNKTGPFTISPSKNQDWSNEIAQGNYSLRITGPSGDPNPGTITLPYGKCLVSGATVGLDPAYYKWTGPDGLPNTSDDVNVDPAVYKDTSDTNLPNGWFGASNAPYRVTNVHFGVYFNHKTKNYEKRWKDPLPNQTDGSSFWVYKPFAIGAYQHWMTKSTDPDLTPSTTGGNNQLADVTKTNYANRYLTPEIELTLQDMFDFISNPTFPADDGGVGGSYPQQARLIQWRFGIKTFVERMMQIGQYNYNERLPQAPVEPFQIERDIVFTFAQYLKSVAGKTTNLGDNTALITFAEDAQVQNDVVALSNNYDSLWSLDYLNNNNVAFGGLTTPFMAIMPEHMPNSMGTSVGAGILRSLDELTGKSSRQFATKVVMLITDGRTNVTWKDTSQFDTTQQKLDFPRPMLGADDAFTTSNYALYSAMFPAGNLNNSDLLTRSEAMKAIQNYGVKFFVILVGNDADPFLAQWLAEQSKGSWIWVHSSADLPAMIQTFINWAPPPGVFLIK